MKIHHLNCGTLYPLMTHWIHGNGDFGSRPPLVTHCLLVETRAGLLLVDTGFGRRDILHPTPLVHMFMIISNYRQAFGNNRTKETAYEQVLRLGYQPQDVRHIAVTHMHLDHVGGLTDFPEAKVHIFAGEYEGITHPRSIEEKYVCRREHWSTKTNWAVHYMEGNTWFGFDCIPPIQLADTKFTFVPLTGHTHGHSAVAINTQDGWLMHCGDAYVYHGDVDPDGPHYPPRYRLTLTIMGFFSHAFQNLGIHSRKLRKLIREHGDEVQIFCSHDPLEFRKFRPDF
jgi:glyoxylase-like metal-dependent hydrolase (beta-lactamase superfamily II)